MQRTCEPGPRSQAVSLSGASFPGSLTEKPRSQAYFWNKNGLFVVVLQVRSLQKYLEQTMVHILNRHTLLGHRYVSIRLDQ